VRGLARSVHSGFGFEPQNAMLVDRQAQEEISAVAARLESAIRIPTEAAGSDSGRCGKRRSIRWSVWQKIPNRRAFARLPGRRSAEGEQPLLVCYGWVWTE
jgi:hypothetical protein